MRGDVFVGCGSVGFAWIGLDDDAVEIVEVAHPERDRPTIASTMGRWDRMAGMHSAPSGRL